MILDFGEPIVDSLRLFDLLVWSSRFKLESPVALLWYRHLKGRYKVDANEELHAKFFNGAYSEAVTSLTLEQIRAKMEDCELVVKQAKSSNSGYKKAYDERIIKLSREEREKLLGCNDLDVSESIAGVKRRQDRVSSADRLKLSLKGLNLSDAAIKEMMGTIAVNENMQSAKNDASKGFTFISSTVASTKVVGSVVDSPSVVEAVEVVVSNSALETLRKLGLA